MAGGWHAEIALPAEAVDGPLAALRRDFPQSRHLLFGFGERQFFMAERPGLAEALLALFPGPAVVRVTSLQAPPLAAFPPRDVVALDLPPGGLGRLLAFIAASIARDAAGMPERVPDGSPTGHAFYAATVTYAATYTCNTWIAEALRHAGLPVSPNGVLFVGQVMSQARRAAAPPLAVQWPG